VRLYKVATIAIHFDAYKLPRGHLHAGVLPAMGRGGTRLPARSGSPADGRSAPTGAAPRGPDWAPAGP
jgi:hypothetical protein